MKKLSPILSEKVWGYELWLASTHPNGLQDEFYSLVQDDYPLLVKVIQANQTLSVQVHPDDDFALKLEGVGNRGKTECWYVLQANDNAQIVYGIKENLSTEVLEKAIQNKTLEQYLEYKKVQTGDFIFIPSGTVHAIGGGLRLLEVQQSCDLTYRLYDWGRDREVHVQKALSVIKNEKKQEIKPFNNSFECEYFRLQEINVQDSWNYLNENVSDKKNNLKTKLLFILSSKNATISKQGSSEKQDIQTEDIFAISANEQICVCGEAKLMLIEPLKL